MMMGLNTDVMESYCGEPVKSIKHIVALAIAGIAVYLAYATFIEKRSVDVLALLLCTTTGIVMLIMAVKRGKIVSQMWKRSGQ